MSSSKGDSEKSEKQRIWELEEQLEDEQHAHRKTKFTLREVQEKLEHLSNGPDSKTEKVVVQNDRLEKLFAENEDLKSALKEKNRRLGELEGKMGVLEQENRNLRYENSSLEKSNEEITEAKKRMNNELVKMKFQSQNDAEKMEGMKKENMASIDGFKRKIGVLEESNKKLSENLESKGGELRVSEPMPQVEKKLDELRREYAILEESLHKALYSMRVLKSERDRMETQLAMVQDEERTWPTRSTDEIEIQLARAKVHMEIQLASAKNQVEAQLTMVKDHMEVELARKDDDLKSFETRLKEHGEEIYRLTTTKARVINGIRYWAFKCGTMIDKLIAVLETRSGEAEQVRSLKKDRKEAYDEDSWWWEYHCLSQCLSNAFAGIQDMKTYPDSEKCLNSNREFLRREKEQPKLMRSRAEGKEWIEPELSSKYIETLERLVMDASRRVSQR